ncbi:type II toxin-antitoxin system CcdA family antitoxin [Dickeya fangzhongdai]|uniref:type II toxin-antitoxin system CcdA family antitoxin n=1 Tax=Dickeya fangzhongdai TaxID=1778540 RepID=UPI001371774E|nr:type II toxin-antitoxin system CcdA family antitoxin [Dickeya fangzhongdai]UMB77767.1 type II toxin-antitoxin system CcdA family antitoxin [Dickeya fangzhongdai]
MKHRISIVVYNDDYQVPNGNEINISVLENNVIDEGTSHLKAEAWKKENREGMEEVAKFIAQHM